MQKVAEEGAVRRDVPAIDPQVSAASATAAIDAANGDAGSTPFWFWGQLCRNVFMCIFVQMLRSPNLLPRRRISKRFVSSNVFEPIGVLKSFFSQVIRQMDELIKTKDSEMEELKVHAKAKIAEAKKKMQDLIETAKKRESVLKEKAMQVRLLCLFLSLFQL
jgi:hypothetical protein